MMCVTLRGTLKNFFCQNNTLLGLLDIEGSRYLCVFNFLLFFRFFYFTFLGFLCIYFLKNAKTTQTTHKHTHGKQNRR